MNPVRLATATGLMLVAGAAHAQCEGDWDDARITQTLDEVSVALQAADLDQAKRGTKQISSGFPCLSSPVDRTALSRYARALGLLSFYDQDEAGAIRWGQMATLTDPDAPWPTELPASHPYLELLSEADMPPEGRADGWLSVAEDGGIFLNGVFIQEPIAHAELPGLVQIFDRNGHAIDAFWQDGAAFSDAIRVDEGAPIPFPRWYDPETGEVNAARKAAKIPVEKIKPERDPIEIPWVPLGVSAGLGATSALTHMLARSTHANLETAESQQDLTRARTTTNALTLVSGLTLVGAVGIGVGGVMVHDNGVLWTVRF